jgi:aldehyde dehydrogenase family protein
MSTTGSARHRQALHRRRVGAVARRRPDPRHLGQHRGARLDAERHAHHHRPAAGGRVPRRRRALLRGPDPFRRARGGARRLRATRILPPSTLLNNGQTCYLGTRVLAPRSRYDEVVQTIAAIASSMPVGDALDPATMIGPMASSRHRDRVEGYIRTAREEGARLVTGGGRPDGPVVSWSPPCSPTSAMTRPSRARRFRAGPLDHPLRRRGGRDPHRQRLGLRARRERLDHGHRGLLAYQQLQSIYLPAPSEG